MFEQSFRLRIHTSNNEAEYESLTVGLHIAISIGAKKISEFRYWQLVISQFHGEYEAKNEIMDAYLAVLEVIVRQFYYFKLTRIPREENTSADALASLASTSNPTIRRIIPVEGIENPSINHPLTKQNAQNNKPPQVNAIVT